MPQRHRNHIPFRDPLSLLGRICVDEWGETLAPHLSAKIKVDRMNEKNAQAQRMLKHKSVEAPEALKRL
jgi:hypothetical protein